MYLLFVDESGKPEDALFTIGGVCVRADHWVQLDERLGRVVEEAGWAPRSELKWHEIITRVVPHRIGDHAFAALAAAPVTCFVVVLWPHEGRRVDAQHFSDPEETYERGLLLLAEQFNRYLRGHGSHGVVVIDNRLPELDRRLRVFYDRLRRDGTERMHLDRLVDALFLSPSHFSRGLQAADLVVGMARGAKLGHGDAERWQEHLGPRFARNPATGSIAGAGLVEFPVVH